MERALKKEIALNHVSVKAIGVFVFLTLITLSAFVRVPLPFTPVPITLQTMFVLLSGAFLGASGAISAVVYIALGASGLPIFTNAGSGVLYLLGPTGGYLFGFVLAALFTARFINKSKSFFYTFVVMCMGSAIILSCGTIWLGLIFGHAPKNLMGIGFIPFVPGDLLKAMAASAVYQSMTPRATGGAGVPPFRGRRRK